MSESIVRKVQPFTIGTKLSVPTLPKCSEIMESCSPVKALDNCKTRHNLNERVSLYLARAQMSHSPPPCCPPRAGRDPQPEDAPDGAAEEDRLNQNAQSPTGSRSIKRITLSSRAEGRGGLRVARLLQEPDPRPDRNLNNNNNTSRELPRIIGVSCETKPNSHFKVLLRKESEVVEERQEAGSSREAAGMLHPADKGSSFPTISENITSVPWRDTFKGQKQVLMGPAKLGTKRSSAEYSDPNMTQLLSLFNREFTQAEAWVREKLRDLKDGCDTQMCPLQDWEQAAHTLQRDIKDYENTLIKLNQEERVCISTLLQETSDKIQLTRRVLDLKQEEQQYRILHEEVLSLALKLEKQGKNDSKNISTRRKHLNKTWLRAQALLKERHETLQLALEVSSFYQQADSIIKAICNKRKSICCMTAKADCEASRDREVRGIASQVMMLDVAVSQLPSLPQSLVAQVTQKQREVKDSWALLQQEVRTEKSGFPRPNADFTREDGDLPTPGREEQCSMGKQQHRGVMGKEAEGQENQGRSPKESVVGAEKSTRSHGGGDRLLHKSAIPEEELDATCGHQIANERKKKPAGRTHPLKESEQRSIQLQRFCHTASKALSWLKENVTLTTQVCLIETAEGLETARRSQAALENEILSNRTRIESIKMEGRNLTQSKQTGNGEAEGILREIEELWEDLKKKHQESETKLRETEKVLELLDNLREMERWLEQQEGLLPDPASLKNLEAIKKALKETSILTTEVSSRMSKLRSVGGEMEKLLTLRQFLVEKFRRKMEDVEEKCSSVTDRLESRMSDLKDSLILSEFLQNVQAEEKQVKRRLSQPLKSEVGFHGSLLMSLTEAGQQLIDTGRFDSDKVADPLEELREAVQMLNDAVKEREKVVTAAKDAETLIQLVRDRTSAR
nr:PREDICTED: spectrin beta chain, non-erythrocytic 1-like [Latimeria chalumnae]|eukprot:XP_014351384.1 PREDICTED: spectrin beta chain, non-erythrocytic 1-like [Latimeria chalumnae]